MCSVSTLKRVLNICAHIIEDQSPSVPQTKTALSSLPNAPILSPIKRKSKLDIEKASALHSSTTSRSSPGKG